MTPHYHNAKDIDVLTRTIWGEARLLAGKFSEIFFRRFQVCGTCGFRRVINAEMHIPPLFADKSAVFPILVSDTFGETIRAAASLAISLILPVIAFAKIANSVIGSVAIDVVDLFWFPAGYHLVNHPMSVTGLAVQFDGQIRVRPALLNRPCNFAGKPSVVSGDFPWRSFSEFPPQGSRFRVAFKKRDEDRNRRKMSRHNNPMSLTFNSIQHPVLEWKAS